ncbi:MAG TPA: hypothetical protein VGC41_04205, partial [Kofleriaceae bacterium]
LGIGLDVAAGQLTKLVAKRPELIPFVRRRGDAITAFNPRDRCWFLDDGLCRIEVEDGRAAKPASCRLFPFNRVFHIGTTMVVDYNSVICPLERGEGVTHQEILDEINTIQDPAITGTSLPADFDLAAERTIATACFAGDMPAAEPTGFSLIAPWKLPDPITLANALVLTPSMRFNELYGPCQYRGRSAMAPTLAKMWHAWLGFAALGETLARRPLGLQELTTLWSEQAPLMHAIARWDDAPYLKPGAHELTNEPLVKQLAQKLVDNKQKRRPLGELVTAVLATADPVRRVMTLKLADHLLKASFAS